MRKVYIFFFLLFFVNGFSQELNVNVSVEAPNINLVDPKVFQTMERDLTEFFNNQQWTNDEFLPEERIEASMVVAITSEVSETEFRADIIIQSIRPVFNSSYKTKVINYREKDAVITYIQNQPIQNSKEKYFDNLSSIMTFYAYTILGFDYDTFAPKGGEKYFRIAQDVVNSIPGAVADADPSWKDNSRKRGRYWLVENLFNPRMRIMRDALYTYHLKGLDIMYEDDGKGKAVMLTALRDIEKVNNNYPNAMLTQMFSDSKNEEIVDVFIVSDKGTKLKVLNHMIAIDPYRSSSYGKLK